MAYAALGRYVGNYSLKIADIIHYLFNHSFEFSKNLEVYLCQLCFAAIHVAYYFLRGIQFLFRHTQHTLRFLYHDIPPAAPKKVNPTDPVAFISSRSLSSLITSLVVPHFVPFPVSLCAFHFPTH
eukprot:g71560.t1